MREPRPPLLCDDIPQAKCIVGIDGAAVRLIVRPVDGPAGGSHKERTLLLAPAVARDLARRLAEVAAEVEAKIASPARLVA